MHALAASLENELITDSRSGVALARRSETKRKERKEREGRKKRTKTKEKEGEKEEGKKNGAREKENRVRIALFRDRYRRRGISDPELVDNATEGDTPGRSRESVIY